MGEREFHNFAVQCGVGWRDMSNDGGRVLLTCLIGLVKPVVSCLGEDHQIAEMQPTSSSVYWAYHLVTKMLLMASIQYYFMYQCGCCLGDQSVNSFTIVTPFVIAFVRVFRVFH